MIVAFIVFSYLSKPADAQHSKDIILAWGMAAISFPFGWLLAALFIPFSLAFKILYPSFVFTYFILPNDSHWSFIFYVLTYGVGGYWQWFYVMPRYVEACVKKGDLCNPFSRKTLWP